MFTEKFSWLRASLLLVVGVFISGLLVVPVAHAETYDVGLMGPMKGPTSDAFQPFAQGFTDYMDMVNKQGGIQGNQLNVILRNTSYDKQKALKVYKQLREKGVNVIHGWGTGTSLELQPLVNEDKIVYFSASYDKSLAANPDSYPYNFFVGASYSQQAVAALNFIDSNYSGEGRPTVAVLRNSTSFGKAPFKQDFYEKANELKINTVEEIVGLGASEADQQLRSLKQQGADYALIQETVGAAMAIIESADKVGYEGQLIGLNWAMDNPIIQTLGKKANGYLGMPLFAQFFETEVPGIKKIRDYSKQTKGRVVFRPSKYVAGWTSAQVLAESLRRTKDLQSGPSILQEARQLDNYDPDGLCPPVSFSTRDQRGQKGIQMYQIKNQRMVPYTDKIWSLE